MARRHTKQKANTQRPKVRKKRPQEGTGSGASGAMGGLRQGFRGLFAGGKGGAKTPLAKALDWLLWLAVVVMVAYAVRGQCGAT